MNALLKREPKPVERLELFDWFDRMFDDWAKMRPIRRPSFLGREFGTEELIHVDQYRQNGTLVVRAELPGIDPDKDVEVTVSEGMLHISAERREEEKTEEKAYMRHELHYGLVLPRDPHSRGGDRGRDRGHLQGRHHRDLRPRAHAGAGEEDPRQQELNDHT